MQHTESQRPQVHMPESVVDDLDADHFAAKGQAAAPLDAIVRAYSPWLECAGLAVVRGRVREVPWRQYVDLGRSPHPERLVRSLLVVDLLEVLERRLLTANRLAWWRGRLGLHGLVEVLVTIILIRAPRLDEHRHDANAQQLDAEPRQAPQPRRPEWRSAITEHELRHSERVEADRASKPAVRDRVVR